MTALETPFFKAESWDVINNCDGNKAPGLDRFNFSFLKKQWNIIKDEIMRFVVDFQKTSHMEKGVTAQFPGHDWLKDPIGTTH